MKFSFLIFFTLYSNHIFAQNTVAEVLKVRGDVSQLSPGAHSARLVKEGDKLLEDTSVLTGSKSFVKLKFIDKSEVSLGPESKLVLTEMKPNSPGVISLLKGRMRAEVEKNYKGENKFFVKTRTAAMGVRGTEFQTIYNPENKVTSLLTYDGEVAMKKIDENQYRKLESTEEKIEVTRNDETHQVEVKKETVAKTDTTQELNKLLKSKDAVIVPPGQNSVASDAVSKATLPVKINPLQLNVLYKNEEFITKDEKNFKEINPSRANEVKLDLKPVEQVAPLEGLKNDKTGDYAPKSGGLIDVKTGLYIAPEVGGKIDPAIGMFVSDQAGKFDKDTGEYAAPTGLTLDPVKGFVVKTDAEQEPKLYAMKEDLNKSIAKDVLVIDKNLPEELKYNLDEKFVREEFILSFDPNPQIIEMNKDNSAGTYYKLEGKTDAFKLNFEWRMGSINRYRFLAGGSISNVNFKENLPSGFTMESRKLFSFYAGGMYALNKYLDLFSTMGLYQDHYVYYSSTTSTYNMPRFVTTQIAAGLHGTFFQDFMFPLDFEVSGKMNFRKRLNALKVKEGFGLNFKVGSMYTFQNNQSLWFGIFADHMKNDAIGDTQTNSLIRDNGGLLLKYIFRM